MDWDKLRVFHAVAEAGSLTHAGEVLHLSQSAVSRQVRGLEEQIGATLFHRHPRGLILTEEGEHLFKATMAIAQEVTAANARILDSKEEIGGELRVTTTVGFGTLWLAPRLTRFLETAPNLNVDLMLSEAVLDLPMREADIAIRMREPNQADVIRRPLMEVAIRLYASPEYLEQHGTPVNFDDLNDHRLISYSPNAPQPVSSMEWLYQHLDKRRRLITVNHYYGVLQAARNHLGVAAIPDYMVREQGGLVHVVPELESPSYTMYLVYPEELRGSQRVAKFRDFMLEEIDKFNSDPDKQPLRAKVA
ncbi:MAG: LysR family transcriptional regulator [Neomegalonema sp.]|nr:LysR family transcriptional regulator [Neomegalonema sp.]